MRELKLILDFACSNCERPVSVTVQYREEGLGRPPLPSAEEEGTVAVNVPCPTCGEINYVSFDASGEVHSVRPLRRNYLCPEPLIN
jgi:hypothetical protein